MPKISDTDSALIAQFLATRGATKVPSGAREYDERRMYLAIRGESVESNTEREIAAADAGYAQWERNVQEAHVARMNGRRVIGFDERGDIVTD